MGNQNKLIDRTALHRNRKRFRADLGSFLQNEAIVEAKERLYLFNRNFKKTAIIAPFPELWEMVLPSAQMIKDEEILNFRGKKFDLILHVMALHWSNDPLGQMIQCLRALRPDGLFLCALMGGETLLELRSSLADAESRITGGLSPRVLPMADIRDMGALLQRAGFALPVADSLKLKVSYQTPLELLYELRAMGGANAQMARQKYFSRHSIFKEMYQIYAARFPAKNGRIIASFEMIWLTGWAPSKNQQKPLRPGSVKMRLSDALQTKEKFLKV